MQLATERLLLRPYRAADLSHLQRYALRPEFYRYLPIAEQTLETVADFLDARLAAQREQGTDGFTFAIEHLTSNVVVGGIRVSVRDRASRQGDLGFALDSEFQGKGYMTEAVRTVLTLGFDHYGLHRIWATADVENHRSWRLLERVGMTREGRLREDKLIRGHWRDSYLYALLAPTQQA